eukprot:CCRYP_009340-RA/>CCRYP_009340-RA protein AED:0.44 eAED:0.44 QI:0/-1/0/1/-1/1/1/0/454
MGQKEIEAVLGKVHDRIQDQSRTWREELSPKINKLLSSITLTTSQTEDSEGEMKTREFLNRERDDWDDSYPATNDSDCDETLYHECSGDNSQTELSSQEKLEELTTLLLAREQSILELRAKLKEKDDDITDLRQRLHENESKVERKTSSPMVEPSDQLFTETNQHDTSIDSTRSNQGSFNDFILTLSEELDTKLSEIDQMKMDHQMQIDLIHDSYESELFTKEEKIAAIVTTSTSRPNQTDSKGIINVPQVEMLVTELTKLKEEQDNLRQALHLGNDAFHAALDQNCSSIMNYIGEELDSLHANELRSHNEALQYELEATRWENAELKAELQRVNDERYDVNDGNETKQSDFDSNSTTPRMIVQSKSTPIFSPLPTFESWSHFCKRFREALAGNNSVSCPKKLVLDNNGMVLAHMFFKELCFAREGTPLKQCNTYHDTCERDDIFIDAISESES